MMKANRDTGQLDLFVATFADVPIKDQRDLAERPFVSLAKSPRLKPIEYSSGDVFVKVSPGAAYGMATIYDMDVLMFAASQINAAIERGLQHSRVIRCHGYDILKTIHRSTSGRSYDELRDALRRLTSTTVETSIRAKGKQRLAHFSFLESWAEEIDETTGKSLGLTITLPDWIYTGIVDQRMLLTISGDYFEISSGIARWLYRVVRKHAGRQTTGWSFTMATLHEKSGSTQRLADFAKQVRVIVKADELPEYHLELYAGARGDECVWAVARDLLDQAHPSRKLAALPRRRTSPRRTLA